MEIVRGALRVRGSLEDGALIIAQDLQPVADIGRVILARLDLEIGGQERRTQLGDKFLAGVAFVT